MGAEVQITNLAQTWGGGSLERAVEYRAQLESSFLTLSPKP